MKLITQIRWSAGAIALLAFLVVMGCDSDESSDDGGSGDITAPAVVSTIPNSGAPDVAINSIVVASFSETMKVSTLTSASFTVSSPGGALAGAVTYDVSNKAAMFQPVSDLPSSVTITCEVTTAVEDVAGNPLMSSYIWTFQTSSTSDTTAPTVSSTNPIDTATDVPTNRSVTVLFDETMSPLTFTTTSFTLKQGGITLINGSVTCSGTTAVFEPSSNLPPSSSFTATITTAVTDLAGIGMATNHVWTFITGANPALGPAPVNLGTAANYAILAESAVSTTVSTMVTGNVGLSPSAGSFLTGFSLTMDASNVFSTSGAVVGQLYAANYAVPTPANLTTAVGDMHTAYNDAANRTLPDFTEMGAGNIQGMNLAPGLYKWGTGVQIPISVTLSGGPDDVWIFQIAQDLTVSNGAIVTLSGGAQAKNIFWQVAGQVVLGTGSDFKGVVLCNTQIVFQTAAVMVGRALAQTAVTLDATTLTNP